MPQFLKARWELWLAILLFIAIKIPALHYPFYWDESWSYAPGVKLMYLHGPSLMPNAIDLFYSRGHPLLFYAAAAAWMRIFGDSHIAQHSFCLLLSVLLVVAVYEAALRFFGRRAAVATLALMGVQLMFFVQSTFLLPEVMVGLFTMLTLFFYTQDRYGLTFVSLVELMLTKESGMVLGLVLGLHATICLAGRQEALRTRALRWATVAMAGLVTGLYFVLQKKLNGWYFYPEHTGYIQWDWHIFFDKFRFALVLLFNNDYKTWLFRVFMLAAALTAIKARNIRYAAPLLPGALIYLCVEERLHILPRQVLFVLTLLSFVLAAWQLARLSAPASPQRTRFTRLSMVFFVAYLLFTCINFFTARYLICVVAVLVVLTAAYTSLFLALLPRPATYVALAAVVAIGILAYKNNEGVGDVSLGAMDAMAVQDSTITYLEHAGAYDRGVAASSFQAREHLQKPFTGFLHTSRIFTNVTYDANDTTTYILMDNIEPDERYEQIKNNPAYHQVYRAQQGKAWSEVYEKK